METQAACLFIIGAGLQREALVLADTNVRACGTISAVDIEYPKAVP